MVTPKLDTIPTVPLSEYPGSFDEVNVEGSENFIARHPEYYASDFNSLALRNWLDQRHALYTLKNLEVAFRFLTEAGTLETRPPVPRGPAPQRIKTKLVQGRLATLQPTEAESAFLSKVADDPNLTDHQRKARDAKLRRAAVAQRRQFPHGEPSIVI